MHCIALHFSFECATLSIVANRKNELYKAMLLKKSEDDLTKREELFLSLLQKKVCVVVKGL